MQRRSIALEWASARGIDSDELAAAANVSAAQLVARTLDASGACRVWNALERLTDDPFVGLHAGQAFRSDQMGPVGSAFVHAENLGAALKTLVRLLPLLMSGSRAEYLESCRSAGIRYRTLQAGSRHGVDAVFAAIVTLLRDTTGRSITPCQIEVHGSAPVGSVDEYTAFFGRAPRWGADANTLLFASADQQWPLRGAAPELSRLLLEHAPELLAREHGRAPVEHDLEGAIQNAVAAGDATLETVATALGVSARTLQRRLAQLGTTFASERGRVIQTRALQLVRDLSLSIDEIALQLGYGSRSSFERAFTSWFGESPAAARAKRWARG